MSQLKRTGVYLGLNPVFLVGAMCALLISTEIHDSIPLNLFHFLLGWLYVFYFLLSAWFNS